MDIHGPNEFANLVPILPRSVAIYDRIPRAKWNTKCVTLREENGNEVANGIYWSIDASLVINIDGRLLGDDQVAIQIVESLCEEVVLFVWMWSMYFWYIKRVFLNGVSLYDHD